jgi:NADH:ubiquinone oxidoreductase subunit 6 (subunit J)
MYSVLLLIGSFIGLAGLYVLLDAPFTAVTQIIVYAGAIMVLFLFVVMLLNAPREEVPASEGRWPIPTGVRRVGLIFGAIFLAQLLGMQPAARADADRRGRRRRGVRVVGAQHRARAVHRPRASPSR